ncbi:248_t:CDS:2, partial [Scutellospora calospora]
GLAILKQDKKFSKVFQELNHNFIYAELFALRSINLPTARYLLAKYFPEILCSLVSSTEASLEIISAKSTIANRKIVSNTIKAVKENIKGSDTELIANIPDIISDNTERIYASGDIEDKNNNQN